MDPLTLIAKLLGATWKVGAAMAVVASVIFYGRQEGISIFVNLNDGLFQTIIVAGLIKIHFCTRKRKQNLFIQKQFREINLILNNFLP